MDGSVRAHRGSPKIRWIPRRSEPASEESELVSYSRKLKSWPTKSSSCRMFRAIKYATNRSENAFPVERKHHFYWQKFSVRHLGCQPVRGAPRHTGDQQLSPAEVAERSQES